VTIIDLPRLMAEIERAREQYQSASPFPHAVFEDFLEPEVAKLAMKEFPQLDEEEWNSYIHANERKYSNTDPSTWGPTLQAIVEDLNSPAFVSLMSGLTGFEDLIPDASLEGGGLHQSTTGGFLNVHADFTVHPRHRHWRRRVNLLLYLNEDWKPEYGGDLELWSTDMKRCERTIAPRGNRVVVLTTDVDSYHGHPEPMTCPPGTCRRSLALYYFTQEEDPIVRSTDYRARPGDGLRSLVIFADNKLLSGFDFAKRRLGISDHTAGKVLRGFERLRPGHRRPPG